MGRDLVIGDIHGAHKALEQCLERCGFDVKNDRLITLGDICDGWPYVYECVEILLGIPNRIDIIGNHDRWFQIYLSHNRHPDKWRQGGIGTLNSYKRNLFGDDLRDPFEGVDMWERAEDGTPIRQHKGFSRDSVPDSHRTFFNNQVHYYKDVKNRLFVHGGFYRFQPLDMQVINNPDVFYWDRELWDEALSVHKGESLSFVEEFSEIFIGHTATTHWTRYKKNAPNSLILIPTDDNDCPPMKADIIYNLDTGAGSNGKLTIMDVDTHDYWQSDCVNEFYGDYKPRG